MGIQNTELVYHVKCSNKLERIQSLFDVDRLRFMRTTEFVSDPHSHGIGSLRGWIEFVESFNSRENVLLSYTRVAKAQTYGENGSLLRCNSSHI